MTSSMSPFYGLRVGLAAFACVLSCCAGAQAQTLKSVKDRGTLACGVSQGIAGFSIQTSGQYAGFDVDFCRALAAAIFDDPTKVTYVALSTDERFRALKSGTIDVLSRNSSWAISRELEFGITFPAVTFYDGQGFMVRKTRNVTSALDLGGSKVCVQPGTTTALNLSDYFKLNGMNFEAVSVAGPEEAAKAYDAGRCEVLTSDASQLHALRLTVSKPADHVILADVISKEPLGPAVRDNDAQWINIVKWVHYGMVNAEELGITSKNVDAALSSSKPDVKRLVGTENDFGPKLGLTKDWVVRVLKSVGNYREVYERNLGTGSQLAIPRGINQLWTAGGIMYAPPLR